MTSGYGQWMNHFYRMLRESFSCLTHTHIWTLSLPQPPQSDIWIMPDLTYHLYTWVTISNKFNCKGDIHIRHLFQWASELVPLKRPMSQLHSPQCKQRATALWLLELWPSWPKELHKSFLEGQRINHLIDIYHHNHHVLTSAHTHKWTVLYLLL